jgi:hypothetical protein
MLKLNYTDLGLHMEWVMTSPEWLIAQHVVLAMRLAQPLHVEPSHASFLLSAQIAELQQLDNVLQAGKSVTQTSGPWTIALSKSTSAVAGLRLAPKPMRACLSPL